MRIAILIYQYAPSRGGAERAASDLARGLLERGHEIHIFSHKIKDQEKGMFYHFVPASSWFSGLKYPSFAHNVRKMLLKERFDIIHSFSRTYYQDILRVGGGTHREYIRNLRKARSFLGKIFSYLNPKERALLALERRSFKKGSYKKIVAISERCREEIIRNFGVPREDIKVIYNGVDTSLFKPRNRTIYRERLRKPFGIGNDDFLILFAGSGFRRKGLAYALEAFALLPKEMGCRMWIIGRGRIGRYRALASRMGLKERVYFLGERDNIHEFYVASDVVLLPTLYEPFGSVCLEAMASGTPVITTRMAGVSEIITDGVDSMVVDEAEDVMEITKRLKILYDRKLREEMGQRARNTAERYSLEINLQKNLALYQEILSEHSASNKSSP